MDFSELLPELIRGLTNFTAGNAVMILAGLVKRRSAGVARAERGPPGDPDVIGVTAGR